MATIDDLLQSAQHFIDKQKGFIDYPILARALSISDDPVLRQLEAQFGFQGFDRTQPPDETGEARYESYRVSQRVRRLLIQVLLGQRHGRFSRALSDGVCLRLAQFELEDDFHLPEDFRRRGVDAEAVARGARRLAGAPEEADILRETSEELQRVFDAFLKIELGQLSVISGPAGGGKTRLLMSVLAKIARDEENQVVVYARRRSTYQFGQMLAAEQLQKSILDLSMQEVYSATASTHRLVVNEEVFSGVEDFFVSLERTIESLPVSSWIIVDDFLLLLLQLFPNEITQSNIHGWVYNFKKTLLEHGARGIVVVPFLSSAYKNIFKDPEENWVIGWRHWRAFADLMVLANGRFETTESIPEHLQNSTELYGASISFNRNGGTGSLLLVPTTGWLAFK